MKRKFKFVYCKMNDKVFHDFYYRFRWLKTILQIWCIFHFMQCCFFTIGDALIFDCNLLHCSGPNDSDRRRWAYLMCYNTRHNNPVKVHHHPCYTPLIKVWQETFFFLIWVRFYIVQSENIIQCEQQYFNARLVTISFWKIAWLIFYSKYSIITLGQL